jgi:hypothetical protein
MKSIKPVTGYKKKHIRLVRNFLTSLSVFYILLAIIELLFFNNSYIYIIVYLLSGLIFSIIIIIKLILNKKFLFYIYLFNITLISLYLIDVGYQYSFFVYTIIALINILLIFNLKNDRKYILFIIIYLCTTLSIGVFIHNKYFSGFNISFNHILVNNCFSIILLIISICFLKLKFYLVDKKNERLKIRKGKNDKETNEIICCPPKFIQ